MTYGAPWLFSSQYHSTWTITAIRLSGLPEINCAFNQGKTRGDLHESTRGLAHFLTYLRQSSVRAPRFCRQTQSGYCAELLTRMGYAIDEESRPGLTPSGFEQTVKDAVAKGQVSLDDIEATIMNTAVEQAKGNLSAAAKLVGLTRRQLAYRLKAATLRTST